MNAWSGPTLRVATLMLGFVVSASADHLTPNASGGKGGHVSSKPTPSPSQPFSAESFGLPANNFINSPYDEWRVYKKLPNGKTTMKVIAPYDVPNAGERKKQHHALDITSRNAQGIPTPLEYKTPVAG